MAVPNGCEEECKPPFSLPAGLLSHTRETASLMPPGALARTLQAAKENSKASDNAAMGIFAKRLAEARANSGRRPFETAQQPGLKEQLEVREQTKEVRMVLQVQDKESKRSRKEKHRSKRARLREATRSGNRSGTKSPTKAATPLPRPRPLSSVAESSAVGAYREATAKAHSRINVVPSHSIFVPENQRDKVRPLPKWYLAINEASFQMKELSKRRPQSLTSLEALKGCIARCEAERKLSQLNLLYEELRDYVHKAEITLQVDKFIVKKSRILGLESGLPRIFKEDANFPSDLKADAYQLYNRWYKEDFEQDILRGISTIKGKDRNGDQLDRSYKAKHLTTAKFYGEGDLVLGQWWPTQLCTVRDGAHGAPQGGIFGEKDKGAYSIVLSGGSGYHDQDDGDVIEYSGTEGKNFTPTENTLHLVKSAEMRNEIRVIRSSQLNRRNRYRPERGLRYDGLYVVTGYTVVDKVTAMHRFRLERCAGQEAIRCEDNGARRPTIFEVREYERLKAKVW
ncbi:Nn.00g073260.m01.CDS01 [Neocucurbitaria sp. VM-36]